MFAHREGGGPHTRRSLLSQYGILYKITDSPEGRLQKVNCEWARRLHRPVKGHILCFG